MLHDEARSRIGFSLLAVAIVFFIGLRTSGVAQITEKEKTEAKKQLKELAKNDEEILKEDVVDTLHSIDDARKKDDISREKQNILEDKMRNVAKDTLTLLANALRLGQDVIDEATNQRELLSAFSVYESAKEPFYVNALKLIDGIKDDLTYIVVSIGLKSGPGLAPVPDSMTVFWDSSDPVTSISGSLKVEFATAAATLIFTGEPTFPTPVPRKGNSTVTLNVPAPAVGSTVSWTAKATAENSKFAQDSKTISGSKSY